MTTTLQKAEKFLAAGAKAFLATGGRSTASRLLAVALAVGAAAAIDVSTNAHAASGPQPTVQAQDGSLGNAISGTVGRTRQAGGAIAAAQGDREVNGRRIGALSNEVLRDAQRAGRTSINTAAGPVPVPQAAPQAGNLDPNLVRNGQRAGRTSINTAAGAIPIPQAGMRPDYSGRRTGPVFDGNAPQVGYGAPQRISPRFDREAGSYIFAGAEGRVDIGKDVVENVFAASNIIGIDPALVMALSWRSSEASEQGALPNSGLRVTGMFAYSETRFLEEVARYGDALGRPDLVNAIRRTPEGGLVALGQARDEINDMRSNLHASAVIGAANTKAAQGWLAQNAPAQANAADLLVAVQFGNGVARDLITARMTNPHQAMRGPLADVVAGMGLPSTDEDGRFWTVTNFNRVADAMIRADARSFAPMRDMVLAEQHRPVDQERPSFRGASY